MNGKVARYLRKVTGFNPRAEREYVTHHIADKTARIYQLHHTGEIKLVERKVPRYLTECVTPERKIYQHAKAYYSGFVEAEAEFTSMPSQEEMDKLQQQILDENTQKEETNE